MNLSDDVQLLYTFHLNLTLTMNVVMEFNMLTRVRCMNHHGQFVWQAVSSIISKIKLHIGRCDFFISPAPDAPVRGFSSEYCYTIWYEKNRMVWLPDGEKV